MQLISNSSAAERLPSSESYDIEYGAFFTADETVNTPVELTSIPLSALKAPDPLGDPNELIKHRFFSRQGVGLIAGQSGIGKSSFNMQMAMHAAIGASFMGLQFAGRLKTLIIQAENDDGDLAEMRDGVEKGMAPLSETERAAILASVRVISESGLQGDELFAALSNYMDKVDMANYPDFVIIDPALAYLGGDTSAQKDVSNFLRKGAIPFAQKYNVGVIIVHHTNKPPSGKEKSSWQAGDFAYIGSGSAEWANASRFVIALRSIGKFDAYELMLAKRGRRAGWKDTEDKPMVSKLIGYSKEPGVIHWHEITPEEAHKVYETNLSKMLAIIADRSMLRKEIVEELKKQDICKTTAYDLIKDAIKAGHIREGTDKRIERVRFIEEESENSGAEKSPECAGK